MKKLGKITKLGKLLGITKGKKKKAVKQEIIVRTIYNDETVVEKSITKDLTDDDDDDDDDEANLSCASGISSGDAATDQSAFSLDDFLSSLYGSAPSEQDIYATAETLREKTPPRSDARYQSLRPGTPLHGPRPEMVPLRIRPPPGSPQGTIAQMLDMRGYAIRHKEVMAKRKYEEPKLRTSISKKSMPLWSKIVRKEFMDPNRRKLSVVPETNSPSCHSFGKEARRPIAKKARNEEPPARGSRSRAAARAAKARGGGCGC